jgi:hypothetical protein
MLLYKILDNDLIKVKLEPKLGTMSCSGINGILLNYYISEYELIVYIQLTEGKENAFNKMNYYKDKQNVLNDCKIVSTEWIHCKKIKDISEYYGFDHLELKKFEENIYYYKEK